MPPATRRRRASRSTAGSGARARVRPPAEANPVSVDPNAAPASPWPARAPSPASEEADALAVRGLLRVLHGAAVRPGLGELHRLSRRHLVQRLADVVARLLALVTGRVVIDRALVDDGARAVDDEHVGRRLGP